MREKTASSEVAWALLTEGTTAARLEAHRIRHLVNRAMRLVENSKHKEHIYEVAGDLIKGIPQRLTALEVDLDRTSYALTVLGEDFLRSRLDLSDRTQVDEAAKDSQPFGSRRVKSSLLERVIRRAALRRHDPSSKKDPA